MNLILVAPIVKYLVGVFLLVFIIFKIVKSLSKKEVTNTQTPEQKIPLWWMGIFVSLFLLNFIRFIFLAFADYRGDDSTAITLSLVAIPLFLATLLFGKIGQMSAIKTNNIKYIKYSKYLLYLPVILIILRFALQLFYPDRPFSGA